MFLLYPDGEDLFLSDIKYDTIAPGQKFKKYAQLSKNEKAMSAIAMILSLFITIGGSSFIVLDGIDNILNKKEMQYLLKFLAYISNDFQVIFFSNQRKLINLIADSTTIGVVDGVSLGFSTEYFVGFNFNFHYCRVKLDPLPFLVKRNFCTKLICKYYP